VTRGEIEAHLARAGIDEAKEEAMLLFCHFSGISRALALCDGAADCADPALEAALLRRVGGEPLCYILGVAYFWGEEYEVSPAVLIPRADTERLVEAAVSRLPKNGRFADLCTGSGCVAISTLASRPDAEADAYDISPEALALSKKNAARNGVEKRLSLHECDLLATHGAPENPLFPRAPYDLILSNPPYLSAAEMAALDPSVAAEPTLALDGGEDGLCFYRHFLAAFTSLLTPTGAFLFEIGWEQGDALRALGAERGFAVEILSDFGGRERVAVLSRKGA
jgi:release factor glutamine methyltransferase